MFSFFKDKKMDDFTTQSPILKKLIQITYNNNFTETDLFLFVGAQPAITLVRLFDILDAKFPDPEARKAWLHLPQLEFYGQSAYDIMRIGPEGVEELYL